MKSRLLGSTVASLITALVFFIHVATTTQLRFMRSWLPHRYGCVVASSTGAAMKHPKRRIADGNASCISNHIGVCHASKYHLPIRRALHFIEKGLQAGMPLTDTFVREEEEGEEKEEGHLLPDGSENLLLRRDAMHYASYHCHHILTSFRLERRRWAESAMLSFSDLSRVMEYAFFAALLLHLTAVYETADKYCEALIGVTMSCSIFLSKGADHLNDADALRYLRKKDGCKKLASSPDKGGHGTRDNPWVSLQWAVVHFTQGVRVWGLLDHTDPLFDLERTALPCSRMLQTFAKIILDDPTIGVELTAEETRFLSSLMSRDGSERWLGVASLRSITGFQEPALTFGNEEVKLDSVRFAQQRRLQLLPLLWLLLLGRHYTLLEGPRRFHAGRYALLRILPLFSRESKADTALKVLVRCFYCAASHSTRASSVEMGVLLARMEQHAVFPTSSSPTSSAKTPLVELLQMWMSSTTPQDPIPEIRHPRGALVAFRNIPRCAMQVVGTSYTASNNGEAFVHELLLLAMLQWSFRQASVGSFQGELDEILLSAQHVASLYDCAKLLEEDRGKEGAIVPAVEATLRVFAVRVAIVSSEKRVLDEKAQSTLVKFDRTLDHVLRKGARGGAIGCVPEVYESNRHRWIVKGR